MFAIFYSLSRKLVSSGVLKSLRFFFLALSCLINLSQNYAGFSLLTTQQLLEEIQFPT